MEDFSTFQTARALNSLPLAPRGVELEGIADSVLSLTGDHFVAEVFGRKRMPSGIFGREAGDATEVIVGQAGPEQTVSRVIRVVIWRPCIRNKARSESAANCKIGTRLVPADDPGSYARPRKKPRFRGFFL